MKGEMACLQSRLHQQPRGKEQDGGDGGGGDGGGGGGGIVFRELLCWSECLPIPTPTELIQQVNIREEEE